ncbi:MAG: hypothetical protein EBZ49_10475, partial [Proteobacteria bacterium]|nr:hypothetical protein [Pseudomonadota bacterium]
HALSQPASPSVLAAASPRTVTLYARVVLFVCNDAAAVLSALLPVLARESRSAEDKEAMIEAAILVALAYRMLACEAPDAQTASGHLSSAHTSLLAVIRAAPARMDARIALAAVCALLGDDCTPLPPFSNQKADHG